MKTALISLIILISSANIVRGQDYSKEFGKISNEEMELKQYVKDGDAEALVLFDIGKTHFANTNNTFNIVFERSTRIKIFTGAGERWSEVSIPYYQEGEIFEQVYDIEAYTYNFEEGRFTKTALDVSNIFDEKISDYWLAKKFAMPEVKAGSVIEYRYKINSPRKFNLRDWEFQWHIPVLYSEYEIKMMPFYEYSWLLQGSKDFDSYSTYVDKGLPRHFGGYEFQDVVHKYTKKDIPAFTDEEFITSINDYIIKIDFQLSRINYLDGTSEDVMTTWESMIEEFEKHKYFGKYVSKSEKLGEKTLNTKGLTFSNEESKFNFVLDYIKSNFNWNNKNNKIATKAPKQTVKDKHGNSADINLLTVGFLRSQGIKAYPVLVSTRSHGKIKYDYPYEHFFNYVLVLAFIDGEKVLTDATEVMNHNNRIPLRAINDKGLIINEGKVEWVDLTCDFPSELLTKADINIEEDRIVANLKITATEYEALFCRENYTGEIIEKAEEIITADDINFDESSIKVINKKNKEEPYILECSFSSKPEIINDKIYISPFFDEIITDNPLKQNKRTYPIDMTYPRKRTYKSIIKIPEGYIADFLPGEIHRNSEQYELNYDIENKNNIISVSFEYFFKHSIYSADNYNEIKTAFNHIVKKLGERIVFAKTSSQ
ncbi:MAG: DUF3857 domain-containing protein [Bacteroidota bacterium]